MKKKIVFLTGTRADFGKLKSLIEILQKNDSFDVHIFVTGMHMDAKYGLTVIEIEKHHYPNIYKYINHDSESNMDITLSRTVEGFANYVRLLQPDLIIVHGDRIETLAGAIVGALNNILVAHVEGGELSGTVDELIRHAVTKLSHIHLVANKEAQKRLIQMGEPEASVYIIGSPDMDVMLSNNLPSIDEARTRYEINFPEYAISMFHPVTAELHNMAEYAENYFAALENSGFNYILIYPNNDRGSEIIMSHLRKLNHECRYRVFPSIRFEYFLSLLKHAKFLIGNSSAGIREAPYYGVASINVGTRQNRRTDDPDIIHTGYATQSVMEAIQIAMQKKIASKQLFGNGKSDAKFLEIILKENFWQYPKQKQFRDL